MNEQQVPAIWPQADYTQDPIAASPQCQDRVHRHSIGVLGTIGSQCIGLRSPWAFLVRHCSGRSAVPLRKASYSLPPHSGQLPCFLLHPCPPGTRVPGLRRKAATDGGRRDHTDSSRGPPSSCSSKPHMRGQEICIPMALFLAGRASLPGSLIPFPKHFYIPP